MFKQNVKSSKEGFLLDDSEANIIKESDLEGLPDVVKEWLSYSNVLGKERIKTLTFTQTGLMQLDQSKDNWVEANAFQMVNVSEPSFLWHVDIHMMPIVKTYGLDIFKDGKASMQINLGGLVNVVNEKESAKLNESAMHRFLLEMPAYPTAALEDYMTWEAIDTHTAKATLTYKEITVSADFHFDASGRLLKVEAMRYKDTDETAERLLCIGEVKNYVEVNDMMIPDQFEVTWMIDGDAYTWYKLENSDFVINE